MITKRTRAKTKLSSEQHRWPQGQVKSRIDPDVSADRLGPIDREIRKNFRRFLLYWTAGPRLRKKKREDEREKK